MTARDSGSGLMIRATEIAPPSWLRSFVASTSMPHDFLWPLNLLIADCCRLMHALGVELWARQSVAGRLGSTLPPEGVAWWPAFIGRTAVSTQFGFMQSIAYADIQADLPQLACPTLLWGSLGVLHRQRGPHRVAHVC